MELELDELRPPQYEINMKLKIRNIEDQKFDYEYNKKTRHAVLADRTGSVRADFVEVGYALQVTDVINIENANLIDSGNGEFKMVIYQEPELLQEDIPVISEKYIFSKDEIIESEDEEFPQDYEIMLINEMKKEGVRYSLKGQILSDPKIEKKFQFGKYIQFVEVIFGDESGSIPLLINDLAAIRLELYEEIEIHDALLSYRSTKFGNELFLQLNNYKSDLIHLRKLKDVYANRKIISHIVPDLNHLDEVAELKRNLHLKCEILSKDEPRIIKRGGIPIEYTVARVADQTGNMLLKLWGNDAKKFNRGDFIQIIGAYKEFDRWLKRNILDIDNNGVIRFTSGKLDIIGDKNYSILSEEEYNEILDTYEYSDIIDIEFNGRKNFIIKVIEKTKEFYWTDPRGAEVKIEVYLVGDSTGCLYLDIFNDAYKLHPGDIIRCVGMRAKTKFHDIHIRTDYIGDIVKMNDDPIGKVSDDILQIELEFTPIEKLKENGRYNVKEKVSDISAEIEFKDKKGKKHKYMTVNLGEGENTIDLVLFDKDIEKFKEKKGSIIGIFDCYVSKFNSKMQIKLNSRSIIKNMEKS